ncbi:hypothetical protein U1Q18_023771 [Sarracenia purpurea var. burkii]
MTTRSKALRLKEGMSRYEDMIRDRASSRLVRSPSPVTRERDVENETQSTHEGQRSPMKQSEVLAIAAHEPTQSEETNKGEELQSDAKASSPLGEVRAISFPLGRTPSSKIPNMASDNEADQVTKNIKVSREFKNEAQSTTSPSSKRSPAKLSHVFLEAQHQNEEDNGEINDEQDEELTIDDLIIRASLSRTGGHGGNFGGRYGCNPSDQAVLKEKNSGGYCNRDTDEQSTHPLPVAEVAALDPEPKNPNSGDSPSTSNSEDDQQILGTTTAQTPIQARFQQPNKIPALLLSSPVVVVHELKFHRCGFCIRLMLVTAISAPAGSVAVLLYWPCAEYSSGSAVLLAVGVLLLPAWSCL